MNSVTGSFEPPDLAKLAGFDTPTICNAIELFEVRSPIAGYMDQRIAACFPDLPPMVGYAATATFRSAEPARRRDGESTSVPVHVGGVTIYPGDLLHGDRNGVTTIPLEIAHLVPYACSEYLKHEALVLDPLRDGNTDIPKHQQAIAEMGRRLNRLKEELSNRL